MWTYTLGPLLALLPQRWRAALFRNAPIHWARAALLSGVIEAFGCLLGLIGWYLFFLQRAVDQQMDITIAAAKGVPGEGAAYAMGFAALVSFALHPLSWALAYFSLEGILRAFAAALAEEAPATLPLALLDGIVVGTQRRVYQARVPLVADVVTRSDGTQHWELKVESCRPKPSWRYPLTIRYAGEFFRVVGEAAARTPARPHTYLLRRPPPGEAFRGLENYDPEDVLRGEERSPRFWESILQALREKYLVWRAPLVPDAVYPGKGKEDWDLKVESCRPKRDWTFPRLICYEGQYYRVESSYEAAPPRPFGYRLRRLPAGVPGRTVLLYSPDEPLREACK